MPLYACRLVDEIVWVKMTVNRRLAKSHGYYLQHAKEVCLVGKKGSDPPGMQVRCSLPQASQARRGWAGCCIGTAGKYIA